MRKILIFLFVLSIVVLSYSFKYENASGISGRITPTDAADMVWAIQGGDSLKTVPANGAFMLDAKAGMYRIIVDAKQPYKDLMLESVEVIEGKTTDLGEIKIIQ